PCACAGTMLERVSMTHNRTVRTLVLGTLLALLTAAFMVVGASAHTLTPAKGSQAPAAHGVELVRIVPGPQFDPRRVVTDVHDTVKITNRTAHTQRLTFKGMVIATLQPGESFTRTFNSK